MENSNRYTKRNNAFSLVEVMIATAVIGVLALIGIMTVTKIKPSAEFSKIRSDVQVLNSAVKVYLHSGGDLSTANSPDLVIAKLKTVRQKTTAQSFVGFTGSFLDPRTSILEVDETFKGARALYDPATKKFRVTRDNVAGFKLELRDLQDGENIVEETRTNSALTYSQNSSWVWDYDDAPAPPRLNPTLVTKINVAPTTPAGPGVVGVPTGPEAPIIEKLLPPIFSIPSGNYEFDNYPMTLSLSNPNGASQGKIIYGIINAANWQWTEYTTPIQVTPADKVLAYVESLKPLEFHHSDPSDAYYDWTTTLEAPFISADPDDIDARTGSTTVSIFHDNNTDVLIYQDKDLAVPPASFLVEYKLIPSVNGQGTETGWTTYTGPFDVGGPQFPRGFEVVAKVKSTSPNFSDSQEATESVTAFYNLDAPVIQSSVPAIDSQDETATITLVNPNPTSSSDLIYQILDEDGNVAVNWTDYNTPFQVLGQTFPRGFQIVAKAMPIDSYYRESDESNANISVNFFGIEITGQTIFILDSSGSMNTNDRMNRLKEATNIVINSFDTDENFAIVEYDSNPTTLIGWGPGTSGRITTATNAVTNVKAGGATNYHLALQAGLDLNATGSTQVIFLSDGYPNPAPATPEEILVFVDQFLAQGVVQFDTVALGSNRAILDQMAARGNGTSVLIED